MQKLQRAREQMTYLKTAYKRNSIEQRMRNSIEEIVQLKQNFEQTMHYSLEIHERQLQPLRENLTRQVMSLQLQKQVILQTVQTALEAQNPEKRGKKGYVQITQNDVLIDLDTVEVGMQVDMLNTHKKVTAEVVDVQAL